MSGASGRRDFRGAGQGNDLVGMAHQDVGEIFTVFKQGQAAKDGFGVAEHRGIAFGAGKGRPQEAQEISPAVRAQG